MIKLGVVVLARPESGGTYQYTLSMLEALRHLRGYEITLYADPANEDIVGFGYPIRTFFEPRSKQFAYLAADILGLNLKDPFDNEDILIAPVYSVALLRSSKAFVYTLHDLQEHYYPGNFSWAQRFWRRGVHTRLSHKAACILCESSQVKSDILRIFDVVNEKVVVIAAPPLRQSTAEPSDIELEAIRVRLGLPERFVFYPAQFWTHKNHLRLIEAFKQVVSREPELKLVLTGKERDQYATVTKAIKQSGLENSVQHLGYIAQADLHAIYHLAVALVMPSLFESVSIPIYEAFQAGTAVAASGVLSIPEQVGDAGLLFDPFSSVSIAESISRITLSPELAKGLAMRGRVKMTYMTPQRYCGQLLDVFERLQDPKAGR